MIFAIIFLFSINLFYIIQSSYLSVYNIVINIVFALFIIILFKRNIFKRNIFLYFIVIIVMLPFINFDFMRTTSDVEKRYLATFPDVNFFHENFADKAEKYINDRIGFRDYFLIITRFINDNTYNTLNKNYVKGKDEWLFLNYYDATVSYFQRIKPAERHIDNVTDGVLKVANYLKENNIKLYMVVAPNKMSVYEEYYNPYIKKIPDKIDGYYILRDYLNKKIENVIMPIENLLNNKQELLYWKDDSHWNNNGAYIFYKEIEKSILKDFPTYKRFNENNLYYDIVPHSPREIIAFSQTSFIENEKVKVLHFKNPINYPQGLQIENFTYKKNDNCSNGLKMMFIHDSFGDYMHDYLFNGVSYYGSFIYREKNLLKILDFIKKNKPDIVVWEKVERSFM